MKVSLENWESVRASIVKVGIKRTEDYPNGALKTIIANDGQQYEFSRESFREFKKAGLLKLGFRLPRG